MGSLIYRWNRSDIQEARVLMNNKAEMTLDDLKEVLLENEVKSFDPVAEAFKVILLYSKTGARNEFPAGLPSFARLAECCGVTVVRFLVHVTYSRSVSCSRAVVIHCMAL